MCLKFSKTPFLALVVGIYLELSTRNGICGDNQLSNQAMLKGNNTSPQRHGHNYNWKGWEDWLPPSTQTHQHEESQPTPPYIPLSLKEQTKLRQRKNRITKVTSGGSNTTKPNKIKNSKGRTEKTGGSEDGEEDLPMAEFKGIRETMLKFATSALNRFISQWTKPTSHTSGPNFQQLSSMDSYDYDFPPPRNSRAVYLDNLDRQDGPNVGKPERHAQRGVVDWLARLIGVQGKTLGEFLREYQVHVLYDLAFTFFKWIFFLYAGLLIP